MNMKIITLLVLLTLTGCSEFIISSNFDNNQQLMLAKIKSNTQQILDDKKCKNKKSSNFVNKKIEPISETFVEYNRYLGKREKELSLKLNNLIQEYSNRLEKDHSILYCQEKAKIIIQSSDKILQSMSKRIEK